MAKKNLRAEMDEDDFHKFKSVMSRLKAKTNDEAIMTLIDEFESHPTVDEAIEVLEEEGYEVAKQHVEEY